MSAEESARLAGVSTGTIRNWVKSGLLPDDGDGDTTLIDYAALVDRKLLRETELLALPAVKDANVSDVDIPKAIVEGVISPTEAPDRRFSISDGVALAAWKQPALRATPTDALRRDAAQSAPSTTQDSNARLPVEWMIDRSGRYEALLKYMVVHKDPAKLPATFWDTRMCPEFIPPVEVFRAWYAATGWVDECGDGCLRPVTAIATTAIWIVHEGELIRLPPDDAFELIDSISIESAGTEPPKYALANLRYRELERTWKECWHQRRRELQALGIDLDAPPEPLCFERRDRGAAIDRYHREYQSPADLPDWFWATETCPPFVPPTGVVRYEFGDCERDPHTGLPRTKIVHSPFWGVLYGDPTVTFYPAGTFDRSKTGYWPKGSTPPESAEVNLHYELARHQWVEEWRHRQRWLRVTNAGATRRVRPNLRTGSRGLPARHS